MILAEGNMIVPVDETNLDDAAVIHSVSWKESHRTFCAPEFVEMHTPERQRAYLSSKLKNGTKLYLLTEEKPVGIVSVTDSLIEDLYVLPDLQNMGYGTRLLQYAMDQCTDTPALWILENNTGAERIYCRMGFVKTGRRKPIADGLDEIEFALGSDQKESEMNHVLETERLFLREMNRDDFEPLYRILADSVIMCHDPYSFDESRVRDWIERNRTCYRKNGFGLWAVCIRRTGEMIGDCGLTLQNINGKMLPEIGYHIRRDCRHKGYAKEAAKAVRDWAFRNTDYPALYSCCKYTNEPSVRTAESVGMQFLCEYPDDSDCLTYVSVISKERWLNELTEKMIRWAESRIGSSGYAGWCLSFIEDALEKSNGIEIFGGDSAKTSCEMYKDAIQDGTPERGAFVFYDCLCSSDDGPVNYGHCGISLGGGNMIHAWDQVRTDDYIQVGNMTALTGDHPRYIGWVPLLRVLTQKP